MILVDMLPNGYEIWEDNGKFYVCECGVICSPAFATLKACQKNGFKYFKKEST